MRDCGRNPGRVLCESFCLPHALPPLLTSLSPPSPLQASLPCARHRLVALAVLETYVRYSRVLQHHPAVIPLGLTTFLDERGMGHPSEV